MNEGNDELEIIFFFGKKRVFFFPLTDFMRRNLLDIYL